MQTGTEVEALKIGYFTKILRGREDLPLSERGACGSDCGGLAVAVEEDEHVKPRDICFDFVILFLKL